MDVLPWRKVGSNKNIPCLICHFVNGGYSVYFEIKYGRELKICEKHKEGMEEIIKKYRNMDSNIDFLRPIIGDNDPNFDPNNVINDAYNNWKRANQNYVLTGVRIYIESYGITIRNVPYKWVLSLLNYVSFEDDEAILNHWIMLFINMINADREPSFSYYTFIQLFSRLSYLEVAIMNRLYSYSFVSSDDHLAILNLETLKVNGYSYRDIVISLENLMQLKLIQYEDQQNGYRFTFFLGKNLWNEVNQIIS